MAVVLSLATVTWREGGLRRQREGESESHVSREGLKPSKRALDGARRSSNNWDIPKIIFQCKLPGRRTMGDGREKSTHTTLEERYFSGWQAYLRMPSF